MTTLHTLSRASGSATYVSNPSSSSSQSSLKVICGVNFPVEVPRRSDEIPDLLLIDVNLRPASGVGQVRERHVEELVKRTLSAVVIRRDWPRMACQVGLQVMEGETGDKDGVDYLQLLAASINASMAGCLDAAVPMRTVAGAVLIGVEKGPSGKMVVMEHEGNLRGNTMSSKHCFAFSGDGECLLVESEGRCTLEQWEKAEAMARQLVLNGQLDDDEDVKMVDDDPRGQRALLDSLRHSVQSKVAIDERWRGG